MDDVTHLEDATSVREAPRASRPSRSRAFPWAAPPSRDDSVVRASRRRWYGGAVFGLLWQSLLLIALWTDDRSLAEHVAATAVLAVLYAFYLVAPEPMWRRGLVGRTVVVGLFALCSGLLLLVLGPLAVWSWLLLVSLSGFVAARIWIAWSVAVLTIAGQVAVAGSMGWDAAAASGILFAPFITVSVGASMLFFGRQREAEDRLGVAQDEITRLAVVEERARFSRDLHDVLGHSLTVVTMKSELAVRLVDTDPARAKAEMQDVERLSREALQGLRQAVIGDNAARLLTREDVKVLAEGVKQVNPAAVEELVPGMLSMAELQRVLQGLLVERVPINDLGRICEALTLRAKVSTDPEGLVEAARAALGPALPARHLDNGVLRVIMIDPLLEQSMLEGLRPSEQGSQIMLDAHRIEQVLGSVRDAVQSVEEQGLSAVLVCAPQLRPAVHRMVSAQSNGLPVLSYQEATAAGSTIETVGVVRAADPIAA